MLEPPPQIKDHRQRLAVMGIFQLFVTGVILLYLIFAGIALFALRTRGGQSTDGLSLGAWFSGMGVLGLVLGSLGVGNLLGKRWALGLSRLLAWGWLVVGIVSMTRLSAYAPSIFRLAKEGTLGSSELIVPVLLGGMAFAFVSYLVLPAGMAWGFAGHSLTVYVQSRDPRPGWVDARPLPVLGLTISLGLGMLAPLLGLFCQAVPFLGMALTGWPMSITLAVAGAYSGFTAWSLYQLRLVGWWAALVGLAFALVDLALCFHAMDLVQIMQMMQGQLTSERLLAVQRLEHIKWASLAALLVPAWYLFWVRKFFKPAA